MADLLQVEEPLSPTGTAVAEAEALAAREDGIGANDDASAVSGSAEAEVTGDEPSGGEGSDEQAAADGENATGGAAQQGEAATPAAGGAGTSDYFGIPIEECPAYFTLDTLEGDPLDSEQTLRYRRKVANAFDSIQGAGKRGGVLTSKLETMQHDIAQQHEQLKNSGSQAFQDSAHISKAKKQLARTQEMVATAVAKEEAAQLEMVQLKDNKNELESHIEEERSAKVAELEPQLDHLTGVVDDLKEQIVQLSALVKKQESERDSTLARIDGLWKTASDAKANLHDVQADLRRAKGEPEKFRAQADVVLSTLNSYKAESEKLLDELRGMDNELVHQEKRRSADVQDSVHEAAVLDQLKNRVSAKARALATAEKEVEHEKGIHGQMLEDATSQTMELQRLEFRIARKRELAAAKERDTNSAAAEHRRMEATFRQAQVDIPKLKEQKASLDRHVVSQRQVREKMRQDVGVGIGERNQALAGVLKAEAVTQAVAQGVEKQHQEVQQMQADLEAAIATCGKLSMSKEELTLEREGKRAELLKELEAVDRVKEEGRRRAYFIEDLRRQSADRKQQIEKVEAQYEMVKNDKAKYANMLRRVQVLSVELIEKIQVLEQEIGVLSEESQRKGEAMKIEEEELARVIEEKDNLRGQFNEAKFQLREKELLGEHGVVDIKALNANIKGLEGEVVLIRGAYEGLLGERNEVALQVLNVNEELALAHQRANQQLEIMKNGELEIQARDQEMRIIQLRLDEIGRQTRLHGKSMPLIPKLQDEVRKLTGLLNMERARAIELSEQLEDPERKQWRNLDTGAHAEENSVDELRTKVVNLEGKITKRTKVLTAKTAALEKAEAMLEKQKAAIESRAGGATQTARQVNETKSKIRDINRRLMATLSELTVHQTTAERLENEAAEARELLDAADEKLEQGSAPTPAAAEEWRKFEKRAMQKASEQARLDAAARELEDAALGRATHYIAKDDPLGLPRPFNSTFRPMEPSKTAATRKIRIPQQKPLFDV